MRKSIDWKVGVFGLIALTLILGLFSGSAQAITGRVTSGTVIAGSMGNTITLEITLLDSELNEFVTVTPPSDWSSMEDTDGMAGYTTVTGGTFTTGTPPRGITITPDTDARIIRVFYGRGGGISGVEVGTKIGLTEFGFVSNAGTDATDFIVVTVDGSGTVVMTEGTQQNVVTLEELAGVTGRNFEFLYTAVSNTVTVTEQNVDTVTEQNVGTLDGGELTLQIPAGWPAPTMGNITVETPDPDGDDGLTPTATATPLVAGSVGSFSISGSGPWTISVPITGLDGQQQIKIKYNNITVPSNTGTFQFPASVRGSSGSALLTPISVATDSGSLEINVAVAGRGSGTMTVSGGPVSAGSTRNTLEFIYSPAGSLDGGGLELVPPLAANGDPLWTEPQGAPGSAGYTTVWIKPAGTASFVQFTTGHGSVNFGEDKGEKRPDFTGKGIGILFSRLRVGDRIRITYGDGGGNNGATAPTTTGLSFFDVYTAPSFSDDTLPIGNADGNAGDAKFPNEKRPFVSIQSGDGIGDVTIADASGDQETFAGEKESLTFTFEADAPMNGGFFSVTVDASWPFPSSANTLVTTTGSTQPPLFLQREVRVPIVFLTGTQTITITYGKDADNRVDAPGTPETSEFVFKSQGTPGGILSAIPDPSPSDQDPRAFEVKVDQARDGSGIVTIPDAEKKATAGATGKTFNITFTAVGQMDGGQLQVVSPRGWTKMQEDDSVSHIAIQTSAGAQVTFDEFDPFDDGGGSEDDRAAVYDITTLRRDQTVMFIYSNVEVQSTRSNNDERNNDGDMDESNVEITDEDDEPAVIKVFSRGKSDSANALVEVADTTAKVVIDSALDGTGTGTITVTDREPNAKTIEADNVPAAHKVKLTIEYEAIGEIGKPAHGDEVDNDGDTDIDEAGERAGGTVRVTIPTAFTTPVKPVEDDDIDNDGDGTVDNEASDSEQIGRTTFSVSDTSQPPTLQIFGRVLTFEGVSLADEEKLTIEIDNVDTPADASTYIFTIEVQGRPAVDADRSLVAIAPSPAVTTGNVVGGKGEAEILVPAKNDDDEHVLIAGATGATVTIEFKAVGPMDGGLVQVSIPDGWTIPQGTPGQAGYVTVVPESGVSIGRIGFTSGLPTFSIPIVTIRKDQKLTITYGAGGGASGATVSTTPNEAGVRFLIKTQMPGAKPNHDETQLASLPDLTIIVKRLEGSGTVEVSPTTAVKGATNNYRFQYTAAGNIGSISIRKPADGWPDFKHPSSTSSAGRISVSRGDIETPTDTAPNATILLNNLNLSAGQTVTINYTNVRDSGIDPPAPTPRIGKNTFEVGASASAEASTTTVLSNGGADVFIVSKDGTGKVAGDTGNTSQDSGTNSIITDNGAEEPEAVRAGGKTSRTFFYNLDNDEFVKGGEVEIIVPNGWTRPAMSGDGKVVIEQVTSAGAPITDLADDAKPTLTTRGQSIIVAIKEMDSGQSIKITYGRDGTEDNATAPTISGDSEFLVRSKTRAAGVRTPIVKNQVLTIQDSKVIVQVVDGASGSGRARSTLPGTVPSGSNNNTITFTFTATAQLSDTAEIRLVIPAGWAVPNDDGGDQMPGTANVTITSSVGDGIDDTNGDSKRDESDAEIIGQTIEVPIDNLPPGQRITIIYGDGDNKAEAQGELPEPDIDDGVRYAEFIMSSKGGESGDDFVPVGDPEDGKLKTIIGNAADGSLDTTDTTGLVTEQPAPDTDEGEANSIADEVYAADSGIEITFTVVASGTMDGGAIRIVPPLGWTTPQGSPGVAGFTQEDTPDGSLGLPAFDGVGAVFNTVDFDVSDANGVMIKYGSGGGDSGATSPTAKATGDDAPKFRIETKGSSDGTFALAKEIPIHIVNARDGTGSAEFAIDTAGAGEKRDYQIRYTAKGTMDDGAIRLAIAENWSVSDGEEKVVVTSSGRYR